MALVWASISGRPEPRKAGRLRSRADQAVDQGQSDRHEVLTVHLYARRTIQWRNPDALGNLDMPVSGESNGRG
jgi:hypothetical protein